MSAYFYLDKGWGRNVGKRYGSSGNNPYVLFCQTTHRREDLTRFKAAFQDHSKGYSSLPESGY